MATHAIRERTPADDEQIVALSLRAWAPVFASVAAELGPELDALLHGVDWREHQEREVRETLVRDGMRTWLAHENGQVAGLKCNRNRLGEPDACLVTAA